MKYLLALLFIIPAVASAKEFSSTEKATDVIELYTSEGCSSCPPADRWLSTLTQQKGLFTDFIPVAFHVDYWNYLGWEDQYSKKEYSQRQRGLVRQGLVSQVYTPGFVINSEEWRGWFKGSRRWSTNQATPGILSADIRNDHAQIRFADSKEHVVHIAYLGLGIATEVKSGENRGKKLHHDFVVLDLITAPGNGQWDLSLPAIPDKGQDRTAIAIWVSPKGSSRIIQATGGYL